MSRDCSRPLILVKLYSLFPIVFVFIVLFFVIKIFTIVNKNCVDKIQSNKINRFNDNQKSQSKRT